MNDTDKLREFADFIIEKSRGFCSTAEEDMMEELIIELIRELNKKIFA